MSAIVAIAAADGAGGGSSTGADAASAAPASVTAGSAWMSIGSISTIGRRSTTARRYARRASATAVAGPYTRSTPAPTDATRSSWAILKFEVTAAAGASPASTSTGVWLLAASVRPVIVLVSPGP